MRVTPKMLQPTMCQALPCMMDSTSSTMKPTTLNATPTPCVMLLASSSMKVLSKASFIRCHLIVKRFLYLLLLLIGRGCSFLQRFQTTDESLADKRAQGFDALAQFLRREMPILFGDHLARGGFARRN